MNVCQAKACFSEDDVADCSVAGFALKLCKYHRGELYRRLHSKLNRIGP